MASKPMTRPQATDAPKRPKTIAVRLLPSQWLALRQAGRVRALSASAVCRELLEEWRRGER
jgi:hypothetical protein